jgi:hypothetical protein
MSSDARRPSSPKRLAPRRNPRASRTTSGAETEPDDFAGFIPAARRRRLRAALADAQLRGALGEALPATKHRALIRRYQLGRRDRKPRRPGGPLERAIVRYLAGIRHEITAAGASAADLNKAEQAIAALRDLAIALEPARRSAPARPRRSARPRKRIAIGRRMALLDLAVATALPGWTDGQALPTNAVSAVYKAAAAPFKAEGFTRPSRSKIRRWLQRRAVNDG